MEELSELCRSGRDVRLGDDAAAEELAAATTILQEHGYVQDPHDPLLFVINRRTDLGIKFAMVSPPSVKFPDAAPQIEYTPPDPTSAKRSSDSVHSGPDLATPWLPCTCIQLDTRRLPEKLQVRIPVAIPHLELRDQRVGIELVIEPRIRMGRANVDVELRTRILFVGVHSQDSFKDTATLGYYPFRMRFSLEPQLEDLATVAIPLYTEGRGGSSWSGTRTRSTDTKIGAQIGFGPVSISGERSWGMQMEESRELEMVSAGDEEGSGNTAVFEWRLLRWSHSGVKYNSQRPHSGLGFTKSLKAPFPGENIGARVNDFPDVLWHLPPTQNFPMKFNFQLDVEMHLVWFAGKNMLFRAADWRAQGFQFCHQFQISPGL